MDRQYHLPFVLKACLNVSGVCPVKYNVTFPYIVVQKAISVDVAKCSGYLVEKFDHIVLLHFISLEPISLTGHVDPSPGPLPSTYTCTAIYRCKGITCKAQLLRYALSYVNTAT